MPEKRIVLIAPFPPHGGGIASYSRQALEHLSSHLSLIPLGFQKVFPGRRFGRKESPLDVPRPFSGYNPLRWSFDPALMEGAEPFACILPVWTAWLAPAQSAILSSFLRHYPGVPVIAWCHNVVGHGERGAAAWMLKRLYGKVSLFITHSRMESDRLVSLGIPREKILTAFLPLHPVDSRMSRDAARKRLNITQPGHLLFLGAMRRYKGLEVLSRAWSSLPDSFREGTRLTLAGEVWPEARRVVDALEKAGCTVLRGYQSSEAMGLLLSSAHALLLPYTEATGSGILMMGMQAGRSAIVSDLETLRDYMIPDETVLTVPPGNANDLAEAMQRLFEGDRIERLERGIVKIREKFTWDAWVEKLLTFITVEGILNP